MSARSRAGPTRDEVARLAQSLMAALVGFVVGAFFLSLGYADILYTLAALSVGLAKSARPDTARPPLRLRTVPAA